MTKDDWASTAKTIDAKIDRLRQDVTVAVRDIAFYRSVVKSDAVSDKIGGSFSGHAADIAIHAVEKIILLFVTKQLETGNLANLESITAVMSKHRDEVAKRFKDANSETNSLKEIVNRIGSLRKDVNQLKNDDHYMAAKLLRHERIAHSVLAAKMRGGNKLAGNKDKDFNDITGRKVLRRQRMY